jgi:serine/threonine protein kinase
LAPRLPDRYQTQVRLGRDNDVEEWLAIDKTLDRPVLVRILSAEADPGRRATFIERNRLAASVAHQHLVDVYAVGDDESAFTILEWNGGVSIRDRLAAQETLAVEEFLPNAAGLADGLAALHSAGIIHGAIDPGAIQFSAAHPAKLGSFGRPGRWATPQADTAAMAAALRASLTGSETPGIRASQVAEGLPRAVDAALEAAEQGQLDSAGLAAALRAIPSTPPQAEQRTWSWGWLVPAGVLVAAALAVATAGLALDTDPDSPFLFPATPSPTTSTTTPIVTTTSTTVAPLTADQVVLTAAATVFDPFGDGAEHDSELPLLTDGDDATEWSTERYFAPLQLLKPGVGVVFTVDQQPATVDVVGTPGTSYTVAWSASAAASREEYEDVVAGELREGTTRMQLTERDGGVWLLWLTDLPEREEGVYFSNIAEVVFRS